MQQKKTIKFTPENKNPGSPFSMIDSSDPNDNIFITKFLTYFSGFAYFTVDALDLLSIEAQLFFLGFTILIGFITFIPFMLYKKYIKSDKKIKKSNHKF